MQCFSYLFMIKINTESVPLAFWLDRKIRNPGRVISMGYNFNVVQYLKRMEPYFR
jgi:hypothetical protein